MTLSSDSLISQLGEQKRARFALLAKVGHQKKEVSQLHEEADFYSTIATELLALSTEQLHLLEKMELLLNKEAQVSLVEISSRHTKLTKRLLSFWPRSTASQSRIFEVLDSVGVAMATDTSEEGYVSPSMDQILNNVARAIEVTKKE